MARVGGLHGGAQGGGAGIRVQTEQLTTAQEDRLAEAVAAVAGVDPSEASRTTVGPTFGAPITQAATRLMVASK